MPQISERPRWGAERAFALPSLRRDFLSPDELREQLLAMQRPGPILTAHWFRDRDLERNVQTRASRRMWEITPMTRFITANEKALWAAIEPETRCDQPAVRDRRFNAYMVPFRTEEEAIAALLEAGGVLDIIQPPKQPGRQS